MRRLYSLIDDVLAHYPNLPPETRAAIRADIALAFGRDYARRASQMQQQMAAFGLVMAQFNKLRQDVEMIWHPEPIDETWGG